MPERHTAPFVAAGPVISARGLSKVYGELRAVDGIDFDIAPGESFGLLGIRERVEFRGGEMKISGKKGKGTTVTVRLPDWRGGRA